MSDSTSASNEVNAAGPIPQSSLPFPVVGIGASAGGLQALLRFFENAPAKMDMAFVVVMHLSPSYPSNADQVLQKATRMRVMQVVEPVPIEKNRVYVIAPGKTLSMADGYLHVSDRERTGVVPVTIDHFFRTLAGAHGSHAIAVVLSGTGSDGAVGIGRVKELSGVTLAQDPNDAEYAEMPQSAISSEHVDIVLPVIDMPQKLLELWSNAQRIRLPSQETLETPVGPGKLSDDQAEQALQDILSHLRVRTNHDFRQYKRATVLRRIERRLQVNALADLGAYKEFLKRTPSETGALLADMLIGVTNFFRDREAFEVLERDVVPKLFARDVTAERPDGLSKDPNAKAEVRAWVAGCSTGEEAYSIAMLLVQQQRMLDSAKTVQVFATDIDEAAVNKARAGVYPSSIVSDVPPSISRQFFVQEGVRYIVTKPVREKILFAVHSILRDPPFSQLNLVSCRNVLIYLDRSVQRQVLELFHFALKPNGYLFLGSAESADVASDLFTVVDKKNRIFRARSDVGRAKRGSTIAGGIGFGPKTAVERLPETAVTSAARSAGRREFSFSTVHQRVLAQFAPPSVIVDRESKVAHLSETAGRFLHHAGGELSSSIVALVLPELRLDLRTTLFKAQQTGVSVEARRVKLVRDDATSWVNMTVRPFHDQDMGEDLTLVVFDEVQELMGLDDGTSERGGHDPVKVQLEEELQHSRDQLATTIEQYETSLEELKASNEELQAINEELRSATEELESSKEELQSVNEELVTVNSELQGRIEETAKANDDLFNIIASTEIATVFVDKKLQIKRFTPIATQIFNLIESDLGRPLSDITHSLRYATLAQDVAETFNTLKLLERDVQTDDGRWFFMRLSPYRTADDRIDGAALTLIDVTARHEAERAVRTSEERLRLAAQTTNDFAIIVQDQDGKIVSWNAGAERVFEYAPDEVIGEDIAIIFTPEDQTDAIPQEERQLAARDGHADDDRWLITKSGRRIYCSGVVTPINDPAFTGFAKIARDLTERKMRDEANQLAFEVEQAAREQESLSNQLKDDFIAVLSHELKHPLNLINVKAEMLPRLPEARGIASIEEAADAIRRSVKNQAQIIDDLLDLSRIRTGKLSLDLTHVNIADLLSVIRDASEIDAHERGINLTVKGIEKPVFAQADPVRCDQILWNLMSNALKFTASGGTIDIALSLDEDMLRVDVSDTGQGIDSSFLPHIFEMFKQQPGVRARGRGGLGIGLALVKQLVDMHGGRIAAQSEGAGKGTCVSVWLPRADDRRIGKAAELPALTMNGLRILIVDDDPETGASFAALLALEGATPSVARSGPEALALLENDDFDVLISDLDMPDMDGYELIQRVRDGFRCSGIRALAASGHNRKEDKLRALEAGFDALVEKPVSFEALVAAVKG